MSMVANHSKMGKNARRKQSASKPQFARRPKRGEVSLSLDQEHIDASEDERRVKKADLIAEALLNDNSALSSESLHRELRLLALQDGGFLQDNTLRRRCWIRLLNLDDIPSRSLATHIDSPAKDALRGDIARQIDLDVARSYGDINVGAAEKRTRLRKLLRLFFIRNPSLDYYQGFHDVLVVLLDVFPDVQEALEAAQVLSTNYYFRDAHAPKFELVQGALKTIQELVGINQPELGKMIEDAPFWGVSMLITGFAHDVDSQLARLRLFDALIASPPYFQLYLVAALPMLPDVRNAISKAEDEAHVHEAIRSGACNIKSVKTADLLVRIGRSLVDKTSAQRLLESAEDLGFLTRESCLFQPFKLDPLWIPPPPRLKPKPISSSLKWSTSLQLGLLNTVFRNRYWVMAILVLMSAVSYTYRQK